MEGDYAGRGGGEAGAALPQHRLVPVAPRRHAPPAEQPLAGNGEPEQARDLEDRIRVYGEELSMELDYSVSSLRDVLTSDGRSLAQAAFGWLWATSEQAIPIPGFKTIQQVEDNAGALAHGPLSAEQMRQVDEILQGAGWERTRFA